MSTTSLSRFLLRALIILCALCQPVAAFAQSTPVITQLADGVFSQEVSTPTFGQVQVVWVEVDGGLLLWDPVFPEGFVAVQDSQSGEEGRIPRYVVAASQLEMGQQVLANLNGATLLCHRNFTSIEPGGSLRFSLTQKLRIEGDKQVIELHVLGRGRSNADLVAYLPNEGMLLTGLLCSPATKLPAKVAWSEDWLDLLRRTKTLSGRVVVPAQGDAGGLELIDRQMDLLQNHRLAVAIPVHAGDLPKLVFVAGRRSPEELKTLAKLAPNVEIRQVSNRAEAQIHAADAHGIEAHFLSAEFLKKATNLRWVQAYGAGVESYLRNADLRDNNNIVMANMKGTHGPAIADHAFAMLLTLTRRLRFHEEALQGERWDRGRDLQPESLHGKTMLVVGLGGIGHEVARRARGFGMTVLATTRSEKPVPSYVDRLGLAADFDAMLPLADVVAVCVPLTEETRGMFGAQQFKQMKKGSYLINVARGKICDSDALNQALRSGHLGGACLDVTDPEPLPAGHPLWKAPNLVLTPHVSGRSEVTQLRKRAIFEENMRRFAAGEKLLNVVDKSAGY